MNFSRRSTRNQTKNRDGHLPVSDTARAWWAGLTRRERLLVSLAGALVCIYLLWAVAIEPAIKTITNANEQLPKLRSDAALVGAIALQAKTPGPRSSGNVSPADLSAALQQSLDDRGLTEHASVQAMADHPATRQTSGWIITIHDAPATKLMPWLASLSDIMPVRTRRVELDRSARQTRDQSGRVSGNIELTFSGGQQP